MSVEVTSVSVSLPQRWQRNDSIWHTECMRGGCDLWEYWWPSHHKSSTVTEQRRASPKECDGANSSETSLSVTTHHRGHNYHFWFTFSFIKEERNCQECVCVYFIPLYLYLTFTFWLYYSYRQSLSRNDQKQQYVSWSLNTRWLYSQPVFSARSLLVSTLGADL